MEGFLFGTEVLFFIETVHLACFWMGLERNSATQTHHDEREFVMANDECQGSLLSGDGEVFDGEGAEAEAEAKGGFGAGERGVGDSFGVGVADLDDGLRAGEGDFHGGPGSGDEGGAGFAEGDGLMIGRLRRKCADAGAATAGDETEDVAVAAIESEDKGLGLGVGFELKGDGGVAAFDVIPDDRAVVFVLGVEGVILSAGGGAVLDFPSAAGRFASGVSGCGKVVAQEVGGWGKQSDKTEQGDEKAGHAVGITKGVKGTCRMPGTAWGFPGGGLERS